jgi:hypothetical protein
MKNFTLFILFLLLNLSLVKAQNVGINEDGSTPNASAILDLKSNNKGLLAPRMTETERNAIPTPAIGLLVYVTNGLAPGLYHFTSSGWQPVGSDKQELSISGQELSIEGGNSVTLPDNSDNLGNHTATENIKLEGFSIIRSDGGINSITVNENSEIILTPLSSVNNDLTGIEEDRVNVSVSSNRDSGSPDHLFDGNASTFWTSEQASLPAFIIVEFPNNFPFYARSVELNFPANDFFNPKDIEVLGSNDESAWTLLATVNNLDNSTGFSEINFLSNNSSYRFIKINIIDSYFPPITSLTGLKIKGAEVSQAVVKVYEGGLDVMGSIKNSALAGSGSQMVVANNNGILSKQDIPVNTDNQTLTLIGQELSIDGGNSVTLPENTDNQSLSLSGNTLSLTNGGSVVLPENTDNQTLTLIGQELSIDGGNSVTLPENTDNQSLSLSGNTLSLTNGGSVVLPENTDNQTLTLVGQELSITGGNTITLPDGADNLGNHIATDNIQLGEFSIVKENSGLGSIRFDLENNIFLKPKNTLTGSTIELTGLISSHTVSGTTDGNSNNLFDGNRDTFWQSGNGWPQWVVIEFPEAFSFAVEQLHFGQRSPHPHSFQITNERSTAAPHQVSVYGSNDGNDWTIIGSQNGLPFNQPIPGGASMQISNDIIFKFIKVEIHRAINISRSNTLLSYLKFFGRATKQNTVVAHKNGLGIGVEHPTAELDIDGNLKVSGLGGSGLQMVVTDNNGFISKQSIPNTPPDNLGNHSASQILALNDFALRLRGSGDANHVLSFNSTVDGPRLTGFSGGQLGTFNGNYTNALSWSGNQITLPSLGGNGNQMVVTDNNGLLGKQAIPDNQTLSLTGQTLNISGGNSVILPENTDNQSLSLSGNTLSLTNGGSVTLPSADNLGSHLATQTLVLNDNLIRFRGDEFHSIGFNSGINGPQIRGFDGGELGGGSTYSAALRWTNNGRVGIGISTPNYPLHVSGSVKGNIGTHGWFNSSGVSGSATGTRDISIYASNFIAAQEFVAFSDARIKNLISRTNTTNDLETLLNIQITDYNYIDTITYGNKTVKKVIAQELEQVYPQAVQQNLTRTIPNIYKVSKIENGWVNLPASTVQKGDIVKLIFTDSENEFEVLEVSKLGFRVNHTTNEQVFVYGTQVTDFRAVDYEALSTLNISATQELFKQITLLNQQLDLANQAQELKNETLKNEIIELKQTLQGLQSVVNSFIPLSQTEK